MRRIAIPLAAATSFLVLAATAGATAIPSTDLQKCADKLQNETRLYVGAVQNQIRLSTKNNTKGKDAKCSGGFACAGGANHAKTCDPSMGNSQCTGGQCTVNSTKGIAGSINKAKGKLRAKIAQFCTNADLLTLFGTAGNNRCPDPDSPANGLDQGEIADCILGGVTGDVAGAVFGSTQGDVMARSTHNIVPDSPTQPISVCGVTLGSVLQIGSESADASPAEAGGAAPLNLETCVAQVCPTNGQGVVGNNLTAPTQTFAGVIPICLVTVTGDSGNGTSQDGQINLATGEQSSFSPISSTVLIGTTCPKCDAVTKLCDSGANAGQACSSAGGTDVACPPTIVGVPPVIPNPLDLDSEPNSLSVPANNPGGGATNPAGTFCGACDLDDTIGCQNDQDCVDNGVCSGAVGSGCCGFGTNTGAFGIDSATIASANGRRGPYLPQLATLFCTGKSGSALVDGTQGLPGPVRLIQEQLNAFEY